MVNGTVVLSLLGLQGSRCLSSLRAGDGIVRGLISCTFLIGLHSSPLRIACRFRTASGHQLSEDADVSSRFVGIDPSPLPGFPVTADSKGF
jgi:hypothetical protein